MSDTTIITANYQAIPALSAMFIEAYANNEAMQAALRNDEAAEFAHDAYPRPGVVQMGSKSVARYYPGRIKRKIAEAYTY